VRIKQSLLVVFALALSAPTWGQQPNCPLISGTPSIPAPPNAETANQVMIAKISANRLEAVRGLTFAVTGGIWSLQSEQVQAIQNLKNDPDRASMFTAWTKDGGLLATQAFLLPGESAQTACVLPPIPSGISPSSPDKTDRITKADCQPALEAREAEIYKELGSNHFVLIIFKPDGTECTKSKPRGTSGDLIYTAVVDDGSKPSLEFTKCDAPALSPNNPEGETLLSKLQARDLAKKINLLEFPVRQCFGTSAEMIFKSKTGTTEIAKTFTLPLYDKFRFSLQVGLLGSPQHSPSFGLRKDANSTDMKIFNKGPVGSGPEYVASVILYGLPHYFGVGNPPRGNGDGERDALASYFGRDPFHENGFADRLGLVLGAGLNNPGDRIVAGLSFELGYGINAIGVYEYAKLKELNGFSEGNTFTGTVEQIPTRDAWKGRWVGGLSIDSRYFTRLIKRATS
jgi:hypothetical protein